MKQNEFIAVTNGDVALVPYRRKHVPIYHQWMQSQELLDQTASERLSLEQEYAMQQSWQADADKCTFIILWKGMPTNRVDGAPMDSFGGMIGDVNLFLNNDEQCRTAELDVMIAEPNARRKGLGRRSALAMMYYGIHYWAINAFIVKIGMNNHASLQLFASLGFKRVSESQVFQEATLALPVTQQLIETISCIQVHSIR